MKINEYKVTSKQEKEVLKGFINHPILYMYNNISKIEDFLDENKYVVLPSSNGEKLYFTELNETVLIEDKEKTVNSFGYSFNFDGAKNNLSEDEYERFLNEVEKYKDTIIKQLLIEEERGNKAMCTPITVKESEGSPFFELFSKSFCFTRDNKTINVTRS